MKPLFEGWENESMDARSQPSNNQRRKVNCKWVRSSWLLFPVSWLLFTGAVPPFYSVPTLAQQASEGIAQTGRDREAEASREAKQLMQQGLQQYQASEYDAAVRSWEQALKIYRAIQDRNGEANALVGLSITCSSLSQYDKVITLLQQALPLYQQVKNRNGEAGTLMILGGAYRSLSQYDKAITLLQQALPLYQQVKDRNGEADALTSLGVAYDSLSQHDKAINFYQQALPLFQQVKDRNGEAKVLTNLGVAYLSLSQYDKAIAFYQQALPIFQQVKDRNGEADALVGLGGAYRSLSQYDKAITFYQQALPLYQQVKDRNGEATVLESLGVAYLSLSQYDKAITFYQQALPIFQQVKDRNREADALGDLGVAYHSLSQYDKAITFYQQALPIFQQVKDRNGEAKVLGSLGVAYDSLSQYDKAITFYQQALPIFQQVKDRNSEATVLTNLGVAYLSLSQYDKAITFYQQALPIFQQVKDRAGEGLTLANIGAFLEDHKQPELAIVFYKQSVNVRETIRQDIRQLPREQQESYTQSVAGTYRNLADLLLSKGRILEAQQVLELLKIQELRDYTRNARAGGELSKIELANIEEKVFNENGTLIAFGQKIRDCQTRQIQCSDTEITQLIQQRTAINTAYQRSVATLEKVLGDRTQLDKNFLEPNLEFRGAAEKIINAQAGTVLIYPLVLSDKLWLLMATEGAVFKSYQVNVSQKELSETVQEFRSLMKSCETKICNASDTAKAKAVSQKLYGWMIPAAMQKELNGQHKHPIKHLVFAPDRVTRYIPMAALFDGKQYLIEKYTVSTIVSAKLTDTSIPASMKPQNTSVLAMGLSNPVTGFNALDNVPSELDAIVRDEKDPQGIYAGLKFLNQAFSFQSLQQHLYGHQILHIATHGVFVPGKFADSYLLLGTGDRLPISQIQQLDDLPGIHLVVLSACETALGGRREEDGLEIAGISNAFLERKVAAVIASLWQVNDSSTSLLMRQFYNNLANAQTTLTKAEALQQTQLNFIQGKVTAKDAPERGTIVLKKNGVPVVGSQPPDFSHPYYWAPFILIGNSL